MLSRAHEVDSDVSKAFLGGYQEDCILLFATFDEALVDCTFLLFQDVFFVSSHNSGVLVVMLPMQLLWLFTRGYEVHELLK